MAPITNGRVLFAAIPSGYPVLGQDLVYDTTQTIDLESVPLGGGVLIKTLDLSVDPYMRQRMRPAEVPSYLPAFPLGEPIVSAGIAVVLRSEHAGFKAGDHVEGVLPHQQYTIIAEPEKVPLIPLHVVDNPHGLKWSAFLGVLGIPGHTAYFAWKAYSQAKKGQTVFVTTGAGALVIQLAKLDGCKVIGSAGSDEKVQFMKDIGADVAFNYKTEDTREVLQREGPVDIYWDNVGGDTFDAVLENAARNARIIACGMISAYNEPRGVPIYKMHLVFAKCITIVGFLVSDHYSAESLAAFVKDVHAGVASGALKHQEELFDGLERAGEGLLAVLRGTNKGKAVIHVADE
ncbi:hypothetical protein HYPSUDRAFT_136347 [Hypholoma sublateritium FD-334 SS-4]|uniref:Enoyl reductase (ER) domain-containing protein n=1 Tax=Hypholoma sublateritium (strain FD-334 SS-4) TaxID=945553 RepID=A0A0D2P6U4_HYPSF|nr:hypothetical protein HYPSUDRAFT_136347 [Hypholoma sublateritium FD-334 SS-4]